jgi:hypothetical protein
MAKLVKVPQIGPARQWSEAEQTGAGYRPLFGAEWPSTCLINFVPPFPTTGRVPAIRFGHRR